MGFDGFRRPYWKNIFSQLEKYFFPSGKKKEFCETCKLAKLAVPLTPTRAYNKVNFVFLVGSAYHFPEKDRTIINNLCRLQGFHKAAQILLFLEQKKG